MKPKFILTALFCIFVCLNSNAQTANERLHGFLDHAKWVNNHKAWSSGVVAAIYDGANNTADFTTLLFTATAMGDFAVFSLAIEHGGNIHYIQNLDNNNTLLHTAAIYGGKVNTCEIIEYINEHAKDLYKYPNSDGFTPLALAQDIAARTNSTDNQKVVTCFNKYKWE